MLRSVPACVLVSALLVVTACDKPKEEAPRPDGGARLGVVNQGLASPQGSAAEAAKATLIAQQCALACGVHPELDTGACTTKCTSSCATASDVAAIDACAQRIAAP